MGAFFSTTRNEDEPSVSALRGIRNHPTHCHGSCVRSSARDGVTPGCNQRLSVGDCASCSEHPRPPALPGECSRVSQQSRCLACLCQCKLPKKFCNLVTPSPSSLNCDHDQSASPRGQQLSFSRRAWTSTAPSSSAAPRWGSPEAPRALRRVMSTTNWAPLKQGKSCASTSMRLSSLSGTPKFMACPCLPTHTCRNPFSG